MRRVNGGEAARREERMESDGQLEVENEVATTRVEGESATMQAKAMIKNGMARWTKWKEL